MSNFIWEEQNMFVCQKCSQFRNLDDYVEGQEQCTVCDELAIRPMRESIWYDRSDPLCRNPRY